MATSDNGDLTGEKVRVGNRTEIVGDKIDGGSEGDVYHLQGSKGSVVKLFYEQVRTQKENKIRAMVKDGNRPTDKLYNSEGVRSIIWPREVVESQTGSDFIGYKMPEKNLDEVENAHLYALTELSHDNSSFEERARVAFNLAYMVYSIHKQGHAIGDFNDDNIFIDDGYVTMIDTDAFHIKADNKIHEGQTFFPRYTPPEGRPKDIDAVKEADRFCLGVHIFQFLMGGAHPYEAIGSEAATGDLKDMIVNNPFPYSTSATNVTPRKEQEQMYRSVPSSIQKNFAECFDHSGKEFGWGRPSPAKWVRILGAELGISEENLPTQGRNAKDPGWVEDDVFGKGTNPGRTSSTQDGDDDWVEDNVFGEETDSETTHDTSGSSGEEGEDWTEDGDVF